MLPGDPVTKSYPHDFTKVEKTKITIYLFQVNYLNIYPVMAGKHEMISSEATIPIRVLVRNDMSMITNSTPKNSFVANNWIEEVLNYYRE